MKKQMFLMAFSAIALITSSCQIGAGDVEAGSDSGSDLSTTFAEDSTDYIWSASDVVNVQLSTSSASADGAGVSVSGTIVTINAPGTYKITGTLSGGQILVNTSTDGIVRLLLNGVTISNASSAPVYVKSATKVIVNLVEGTTNTLTDTHSDTSTEPNAALFSNANMTIFGAGSLSVKGTYADGISSDDGLLLKSGVVTVSAADDAVRGKDYLIVEGGTVSAIGKTGHGLKSDNEDSGTGYVLVEGGTITSVSTSGDALLGVNQVVIKGGVLSLTSSSSQGIKGGSLVEISGGNTTVVSSHEGIESSTIIVSGGTSIINASNDAINATYGTVNGGTESNDGSYFYMKGGILVANGSDAVDSNGNIQMTGGTLIVNGPMSGIEEGVDCNGMFNVNGGVLISSGSSSQMTKAMSTSSTQVSLYIKSSSAISSTSLLHIEDASGNDLITFKPKNGGYYFHASSSALTKGSSCKIYSGGSYSGGSFIGGTSGYGLYTGGTYSSSGASLKFSPTLSSSSTVNTITF
jgi:hypothetical protein